MATIGIVSDIPRERDFEWRIEDFWTLSKERDVCYLSPSFSYAGESWCLKIYPNGQKEHNSIGFIGLYLWRESSEPPILLDYSLIMKTMGKVKELNLSHIFRKAEQDWGYAMFVKRSEFLGSGSGLGQPVSLTVICTMKNTDDTSKILTATCSFCQKKSDSNNISFHESKCLEKPFKCPECGDVSKLKDWYDHECSKTRIKDLERLSHDLKDIMLNGDNRNTTIKVKGEEIAVHSDILAGRSLYFKAMFKNDMKEKNTGTVFIDDCEPDTFRTFLHFIYTGRVDKLSAENVCELYETTDKYQEDQLKKYCLDYMMKTISEDTFFEFTDLALRYDEKTLFEKAAKFFVSKPKEMFGSVKWQNFAKKYPTQANELIAKTLDHLVK